MCATDVNILSDYTVFSPSPYRDTIASVALKIIPMISTRPISPVNRVIDRWLAYSNRGGGGRARRRQKERERRDRDNRLQVFPFSIPLDRRPPSGKKRTDYSLSRIASTIPRFQWAIERPAESHNRSVCSRRAGKQFHERKPTDLSTAASRPRRLVRS